jgi:hypothetical protein
MSLHHVAKHLENQGRGKDTVLVHMTPREVGGLQALAKAHGGSLTKNPETGLYEAGFLEQILPIVAAGAAMYFTAGAATPLLMSAGMGATSAGILAGAGAGALIGGGSAAIQGGDVGQGALMGGVTGAIGGGLSAGLEGLSAAPTGTEGIGGLTPGSAPLDPNLALSQSTTVGTAPVSVNSATGQMVDPLSNTGVGIGGAPRPGFTPTSPNASISGIPQGSAIPTPTTASSLVPNANSLATTPVSSGPTSPMADGRTANQIAGDKLLKEQADAVARAKANPDSSWWSKQTPLEKAGYTTAGAGLLAAMNRQSPVPGETDTSDDGSYLKRISPNFRAQEPIRPNPYYRAQYPVYAAEGGLMGLAAGGQPLGPVEEMSRYMMKGQGNMFPQSQQEHTNFATPTQMPASAEVIRSDYDAKTDPYNGVMMAEGGIADLGSYSDGGRLLKGPGDGVSDNIPATIGGHQPARLADGEFVVPARIVSELGNGSTDAGAKRLYAMMERVQAKRKKSMGKGKFAVNSKADKDLPA